jgi:hypothetical protein
LQNSLIPTARAHRGLVEGKSFASTAPQPVHIIPVRVMPELVSKFGLLDRATIQRVIEAYGLVEEHYGKLLILEGGKVRVDLSSGGRHVVWLPPRQAPTVLKINADLSEETRER